MGLFRKLTRVPPPTATDVVQDESQIPSAVDLEKHRNDLSTIETMPQTQNEAVLPAVEKRVVRKMDFRIVPLVTALYVLAFLDRSNIGNARIAGMSKDCKFIILHAPRVFTLNCQH